MADGQGNSTEQPDPSFNVDNWVKELFPDGLSSSTGMDRARVPRPSTSNSVQIQKTTKPEENYQAAPPMSNVMPSRYMGSSSARPVHHIQQTMPNTFPTTPKQYCHNQSSCNMVSPLQLHQQLRPVVHPLPVQSNTYLNQRQQLPMQVSVSQMMQPPRPHGTYIMKPREQINVPQRIGQTMSEKNLQQMSQHLKNNQAPVAQSGLITEGVNPQLQQASASHQSQNVNLVNQLQGRHQQAMIIGPSQVSDITPSQVASPNVVSWADQAFQQILLMKEMYLTDVIKLYNGARESWSQATNAEAKYRCEKVISSAENIFKFLQITKSDLMRFGEEKAYQTMSNMAKYLERVRPRSSPQQVEASGNHPKGPQGNLFQFNSATANSPLPSRRQGALNIQSSSANTFHVGSSQNRDMSPRKNARIQENLIRTTDLPGGSASIVSQVNFDQNALGVSSVQHRAGMWRNVSTPLGSFGGPPIGQSSVSRNIRQDAANKAREMKKPVERMPTHENKPNFPQAHLIGPKNLPMQSDSTSYHGVSPQNSQNSSSQFELTDFSTRFSKSVNSSLPASPSAFTSPLTPLTPSSKALDSEKSPFCPEEGGKPPKTPVVAPAEVTFQDTNAKQDVSEVVKVSEDVPLPIQAACPNDNQSTQDEGSAVKRLINVVKSMSSKALNSGLEDIAAVTDMTDKMAINSLHGESTKFIIHDLADDIRHFKAGNFRLVDGTNTEFRVKRQLEITASTTPTESPGIMKKLRKHPSDLLIEEIEEINKRLIEVVVDAVEKDDSGVRLSDGTYVTCSYNPVAFLRNVDLPNTEMQMFRNLILELFVPADYPNSPPTVLDTVSPGCREAEEGKEIWMKAKTKFSLAIRNLEQPILLKDMAKTWDHSARELFNEFAQARGGGTFSSKYGKWEDCVVAV